MKCSIYLAVKNTILFLGVLIICFLICESAIRIISLKDLNGNYILNKRIIKPLKLPLNTVSQLLEEYKNEGSTYIIYDSIIGWKPSANFKSIDGQYIHNNQCMRSLVDYDTGNSSFFRVALFGDSHVYGDEILFEQTFGSLLEKKLRSTNFKCEVLNFGVGAFGIDQAYLRWKHEGVKYNSNLIILGFQPENMFRNTNMIRSIYHLKDQNPFFKPRFILIDDSITLINSPTPQLDQIIPILSHLDTWNIVTHENYFHEKDYSPNSFVTSRFINFTKDVININRFTIYEHEKKHLHLNPEIEELALRIISKFKYEVEKSGGTFAILHLPRKSDLEALKVGKKLSYEQTLQKLKSDFMFIETSETLLNYAEKHNMDSLFAPNHHLSAIANQLIASCMINQINFTNSK